MEPKALAPPVHEEDTPEEGKPMCRRGSNLKKLVGVSEDLRTIFDACDADGSGTLDKEDIAKAFKDMHIELSNEDVDTLMDEIDTNRDGICDFDEFQKAFNAARLHQGIDIYIKTNPVLTPLNTKKHLESAAFKDKLLGRA
eukprot:3903316-Prymnesium_polylepis.2